MIWAEHFSMCTGSERVILSYCQRMNCKQSGQYLLYLKSCTLHQDTTTNEVFLDENYYIIDFR